MIVSDIKALRKRSRETTLRNCLKLNVFERMEQELKAADWPGAGLAAVQIGEYIRAGIVRMKRENLSFNYINPRIIRTGQRAVFHAEGCFSVPKKYVNTERFKEVTVEFTTDKKRFFFFSIKKTVTFKGLAAVVMQHEIDHMDGILFLDRGLKQVRRAGPKLARNKPCPCGSKKKYKKCCFKKRG